MDLISHITCIGLRFSIEINKKTILIFLSIAGLPMKLNVTLIVFNFIAYNNFYNFLILQRVSDLKMRKNTILSNSNEKSDQKNFWKKKKKPICLKINEKEADDNLVYRALKNQRDAKTILNFILGDMGSNKSSAKNKRPKSELNHPFHLPTSE